MNAMLVAALAALLVSACSGSKPGSGPGAAMPTRGTLRQALAINDLRNRGARSAQAVMPG